ncbi:beta-ketoacyl-[acyl-carrier-protein] synthase family protein [Streptomyces longwoodensis]|uniref:beta-ketoacyl-[acyl-carrier-protein] synthase family protein n=1 Tax=Streptomyces longwoodensis TaxID=68231 RepID=UPI0033C1D9F0
MTAEPAVAITGLGLVSAAGVGVEANWARVLSGCPTAAEVLALKDACVPFGCAVPDFDATSLLGRRRAGRLDRYTQLMLVAAAEAIEESGVEDSPPVLDRTAVVIGTAAGGTTTAETQIRRLADAGPSAVSPVTLPMALPNMAAAEVAIGHGFRGPVLATCTACASGATAVGIGLQLLRSGAADKAVVGGTEAVLTPYFAASFARTRALSRRSTDPGSASRPFDACRDGFVMGEGAGALVLETLPRARERGARIRALLCGYGASADAHHITAPEPEGRGAELAVRAALADAGWSPGQVRHINAHGTSTPRGDAVEARLIERVFGPYVPVTSTKGVTGHPLGAGGAIEAVFTAISVSTALVPPTANFERPDPGVGLDIVAGEPRRGHVDRALSFSFGFGGANSVLAIARA